MANLSEAFEYYRPTYEDHINIEIELIEAVLQDKPSKPDDKLLPLSSRNHSDGHLSLDNIHPNFYKLYKSNHFSSPPERSQPDSIKEETNEIGNLRNEKYR